MTADQALKCDAATRRDQGVRATAEQGLVSPATPVAGLLDVTGIRASAASLRAAFEEVTAPGTPSCTPSP